METKFKVKQITFIAIMSAINIIFVILNLFLPFFTLILIIGLPFTSLLVNINAHIKYQIIYLITTVLICSLIDFQASLFYIIPSIINGLLFGFFIRNHLHGFYLLVLTSIICILTQSISIMLINLLYQIDMLDFFSRIFNISLQRFSDIYLVFLFGIGLLQNIFSYLIIEDEIKKFKFRIDETYSVFIPVLVIAITSSSLGFIHCIPACIRYLFTAIGLLFTCYLILYLFISKIKVIRYIQLLLLVINFFICLGTITSLFEYSLIFNIFSLTMAFNGVIFILYIRLIKKDRINPTLFNKERINEEY